LPTRAHCSGCISFNPVQSARPLVGWSSTSRPARDGGSAPSAAGEGRSEKPLSSWPLLTRLSRPRVLFSTQGRCGCGRRAWPTKPSTPRCVTSGGVGPLRLIAEVGVECDGFLFLSIWRIISRALCALDGFHAGLLAAGPEGSPRTDSAPLLPLEGRAGIPSLRRHARPLRPPGPGTRAPDEITNHLMASIIDEARAAASRKAIAFTRQHRFRAS